MGLAVVGVLQLGWWCWFAASWGGVGLLLFFGFGLIAAVLVLVYFGCLCFSFCSSSGCSEWFVFVESWEWVW